MALAHPFDPIIDNDSRILILGTFPSIKSFENAFYYGHPQNQFWKLLAALFDEEIPQSNEEKIAFLRKHRVALWDMVGACERTNSLDSSLRNITPNDIEGLVKKYPNIRAIFFTGKKAKQLYERYFSHLPHPTYYLPSPSPAYRVMSFAEKLERYKLIKDYVCEEK